ncbi:MAG: two-component system regulatory protein YycI [Firmicutes bacterium]|nr:two-component system regulatory protein YycI [Bacillota bacterium]
MDWEKAKKTFIYLLIVLNILLFAANYVVSSKYKLTQKEEAAVHQVMSNSGMGIYCNLIKENKPMRSLGVSAADFEGEEIKNLFFDEDEEFSTTLEFEQIVFENEDKRLEVQDNLVKFYCYDGTGRIANFGRQTAKDAAEEFINKRMTDEKSSLQRLYQLDDRYVFEFDGTFSGYKVFSSKKRVEVDKNGVVYCEITYYNPEGFTGDKLEICGSDEALLSVLYKVKEEGDAVGRYVEDMEIGYDLPEESENYNPADIKLVPCYRVYVSGAEEPYKVNAYTNSIIENQ